MKRYALIILFINLERAFRASNIIIALNTRLTAISTLFVLYELTGPALRINYTSILGQGKRNLAL